MTNKYLKGFARYIFQRNVSILAIVDNTSIINKRAHVSYFTKILNSKLGAYSYITKGSELVYTDVGKFCSIGHNCKIGLASHTSQYLSTSPLFTEIHNATKSQWSNHNIVEPYKRTKIGNDVWIGDHVLIIGGISIGDGAIIGAGAVVTKDVPPYAIVGGVPAKVIKYRFDKEIIDRLEELKWWDKPDSYLKEHIEMFQRDNIRGEDINNGFNI